MLPQDGFTFIELILTLVILGILAAVAIPKFVDLQDKALAASKAQMSGVVKSAHIMLVANKLHRGSRPFGLLWRNWLPEFVAVVSWSQRITRG